MIENLTRAQLQAIAEFAHDSDASQFDITRPQQTALAGKLLWSDIVVVSRNSTQQALTIVAYNTYGEQTYSRTLK